MLNILIGILLALTSTFLILLVLIQRGRGGGLTGALGGTGGQSAFGAKAGDVFTRVTIIAASVWILLCVAAVKIADRSAVDPLASDLGAAGEASSGSLTPGSNNTESTTGTPSTESDSTAGNAAAPTSDEAAPSSESAPANNAAQ